MPQMLASGNASLAKKVTLLLHTLWMTIGPPRMHGVLNVCNNIMSFTTDMGTELGLAEFEAKDLRSVLPSWLSGKATPDGRLFRDDGFIADEELDLPRHTQRVFPSGLIVAGNLHIIHNLSWFSNSKLKSFSWFVDGLKHVVTLLHYRHHRERFIEHCVLTSPYRGSVGLFRKGVPLVTDWRWGSVVHIIELLIPLKFVLTHAFDARVFKAEDGEDLEGEGEANAKAKQGF